MKDSVICCIKATCINGLVKIWVPRKRAIDDCQLLITHEALNHQNLRIFYKYNCCRKLKIGLSMESI